jgi:hypothetical protein
MKRLGLPFRKDFLSSGCHFPNIDINVCSWIPCPAQAYKLNIIEFLAI